MQWPGRLYGGRADIHGMESRWTVTIQWRPVIFVVAMFWFWYLAPAAVESRTLARVIELLQP